MKITKEMIESEEDYAELQKIGKLFREDGHTIALNTNEKVLKEGLLKIFEAEYANAEAVDDDKENEELTAAVDDAVDEAEKVELGADDEADDEEAKEEADDEEAQPDTAASEEAPKEVAEEPEEEIEEPEEEVEIPVEKKYMARIGKFSIWLAADESLDFNAIHARTIPDDLTTEQLTRVDAAIKKKRIILME